MKLNFAMITIDVISSSKEVFLFYNRFSFNNKNNYNVLSISE